MKNNDLSTAIQALKEGEVIIYPTDTLYALGADIFNEIAVKKVFDIKRRPYVIPLPVAVSSIDAIDTIAVMNEVAWKLCETFLPGSLTMILKKNPVVPSIVTSGFNTIAIRVPNHPIAIQLLSAFGPLTVTSANLHQKKTEAMPKDILKQLKAFIPVCLSDGRKEGAASTIIDLSEKEPHILREGSISKDELLDVISHE